MIAQQITAGQFLNNGDECMTKKITVRGAICLKLCIMTVSLIACVQPKGNIVRNKDREIKKGEEYLIKEARVDARYIRSICKRAKWIYDAKKYRMEGGNYSWYIYRPLNNEEVPPGICVYISPRGGSFSNVDRWRDIMDKHNLIYIASRDSSNYVLTEHRMALTLRAIDIVIDKYKVDMKRIYVCGDSGGGRVSSFIAPLYPEIIKGAIYSIGCDFWDTIKMEGDNYYPGFLCPIPGIKVDFLKIKKIRKNRFVFLTGDFDANRAQTKANYKAYLESGIQNCAYIQVKDMGHAYPPPEYWQAAFAYLDG